MMDKPKLSLLLSVFFVLLGPATFCQVIIGKVVKVADGDTITILDSTNTHTRVRLYGIDCPENGQDFSNVAKKFTSDLCFGRIVGVEVKDIDRYGRTVGIVVLPDSTILNKELLKAGLAWHYKHFDKSAELAELEERAKAKKIGLWSHKNPIAPWEYRTLVEK